MTEYSERVAAILQELGIAGDYLEACNMPLHPEARQLEDAGPDMFGRPQRMTAVTLQCWRDMQTAAERDGVALLLVSAFRNVEYQRNLIRAKLDKGQRIEDILRVNAAPGYSEHHTGRALDLATPEQEPLIEAFETTDAFRWLMDNAARFSFSLSYPRDNPYNITYEPWHWANHRR